MSDLNGKVLRLIPGGGRKERVKPPLDGAARDELLCASQHRRRDRGRDVQGYEADAGLTFVAERLRALAEPDGALLT